MKKRQKDIPPFSCTDVGEWLKKAKENKEEKRYISFDYCYYYFYENKSEIRNDKEKSCAILWAFLASWGMIARGTNLQKNGNWKSLEGTIDVIASCFASENGTIPNLENDDKKQFREKFVSLYKEIEKRLIGYEPSKTLITKIILGVFGAFPALDTNFCDVFGDTSCKVYKEYYADIVFDFYKKYQDEIDKCKIPIQAFGGQQTKLFYPPAKLIDMFGFFEGKKGK